MNHLTAYVYEEGGKLFLYRCPECGSTGPEGSRCEAHEPPLGSAHRGPLRVRVLVPEAGEERQAEALLKVYKGVNERLSAKLEEVPGQDETNALLDLMREADQELAERSAELAMPGETARVHQALHHFTQQPAGVGADNPSSSGSADSDGNQQPLGGDVPVAVPGKTNHGISVAEGGWRAEALAALKEFDEIGDYEAPVGVLRQLLDHPGELPICGSRNGTPNTPGDLSYGLHPGHQGRHQAEGKNWRVWWPQHPSGGQEGGVEEGAIPKRWSGEDEGEHWSVLIEHDRMEVGEPCVVAVEVANWEQGNRPVHNLACATPTQAREMADALRRYADEAEREDPSISTQQQSSDQKRGKA
jgi:hypothetical protein